MQGILGYIKDNLPAGLKNSTWVLIALYALYLLGRGNVPGLPLPGGQPITPIPIPAPPILPPPPVQVDPLKATVRITTGNSGCTATILAERPSQASYYMLTAAHCVRGSTGRGKATFAHGNGKVYDWSVVRTDPTADLCLAIIMTEDELPGALLADAEPDPGVEVWHQGFGTDRPGNLETGKVTARANSQGQVEFDLSVSSGDSGSGMFRKDNGKWVGAVCCGSGRRVWGGGVTAARRLMTKSWEPDEPCASSLAPYITCGQHKSAVLSSGSAPGVPMEVIEEKRPSLPPKSDSAPAPKP